LPAVQAVKHLGLPYDGSGFLMRNRLEGLFPIQPEITSVFMGKRDRHFLSFSNVPVDLLLFSLSSMPKGVFGSFLKSRKEFNV
jgi:hypothetical protein